MSVFRKVGVVSLGKFCAVLGLIGGLLFGLMGLLGASVLASVIPGAGLLGAGAGLMMLVTSVIGGAIGGFIYGVVFAVIFNLVSSFVGGVEVTITKGGAGEAAGVAKGKMPAKPAVVAGRAQGQAFDAAPANAKLVSYVRECSRQGQKKDEIVAALVKAGWKEADIHKALDEAFIG